MGLSEISESAQTSDLARSTESVPASIEVDATPALTLVRQIFSSNADILNVIDHPSLDADALNKYCQFLLERQAAGKGIITIDDFLVSGVSSDGEEKFLIEDRVGKGGLATVYGVRSLKSVEKKEALKAPPDITVDPVLDMKSGMPFVAASESGSNEQKRERFNRECRNLVRVSRIDPGAVPSRGTVGIRRLHQGSVEIHRPFYTQELIPGISLKDLLVSVEKEGRVLDIEDAVSIFMQFLVSLNAVHKAGVVHRDIKPENVMLRRDGKRAVIVDFGMSFIADEGEAEVDHTVTSDHSFTGTLDYASPEQVANSASVGLESDANSAAQILVKMLTQKSYYSSNPLLRNKGDYEDPAVLGILGEALARSRASEGDRDFAFKTICRMLTPEPQDRPSLAELGVALRPLSRYAKSAPDSSSPALSSGAATKDYDASAHQHDFETFAEEVRTGTHVLPMLDDTYARRSSLPPQTPSSQRMSTRKKVGWTLSLTAGLLLTAGVIIDRMSTRTDALTPDAPPSAPEDPSLKGVKDIQDYALELDERGEPVSFTLFATTDAAVKLNAATDFTAHKIGGKIRAFTFNFTGEKQMLGIIGEKGREFLDPELQKEGMRGVSFFDPKTGAVVTYIDHQVGVFVENPSDGTSVCYSDYRSTWKVKEGKHVKDAAGFANDELATAALNRILEDLRAHQFTTFERREPEKRKLIDSLNELMRMAAEHRKKSVVQ